jgi:hypothetical protein
LKTILSLGKAKILRRYFEAGCVKIQIVTDEAGGFVSLDLLFHADVETCASVSTLEVIVCNGEKAMRNSILVEKENTSYF